MKKISIVLALLMSSVICFAQDSSKKVTDTSQITASKVYNDVKSALSGLASALKVGSEHVYKVVIRQQTTNSVIGLITLLVLFIIFIVAFKYFLKNQRRTVNPGDDWYNDEWVDHISIILPFVVSLLLSITILIFLFCSLSEIITGFTNPEYGGMKDIVSWIK